MNTEPLRVSPDYDWRSTLPEKLTWAVEAAQGKKAFAVAVLDLRGLGAFTDLFILCSGSSSRQVQAISDEIEEHLRSRGARPLHREGNSEADWVLLDYGSFVVHVFHEEARLYYDLERLWRTARRIDVPDADALPGTPEP